MGKQRKIKENRGIHGKTEKQSKARNRRKHGKEDG